MQDRAIDPKTTKVGQGEQIIERLRAGEMPKMVDWFDPILLGKVGVRTLISATIGQYADQRPMQAMADDAGTEDKLVARHDFSDLRSPEPDKRLTVDADGSVWVDFIADLGDGFEATYAMAYLMASERLVVAGPDGSNAKHDLKAGEILIFGGDLAYPDATVKEYQDRCIQPYNLAFSVDQPKRKLFFIAGNHDWYDGLAAFTSVFCAARDRVSRGLGKQIGGWRCQQRRSYFAMKLPYDWWVWGIDVQLNLSLDDAQRDYFDLMSERTRPGDKVIIVLHFPIWFHENYDILHEVTMMARKNGAEVPAVLAGDLHHYSRYYADKFGVHLITSGGGGAFAHPTHQLDHKIEVSWPVVTGAEHRVEDAGDRPEFNRAEKQVLGESDKLDYTERKFTATDAIGTTPRPRIADVTDLSSVLKLAHSLTASNIYPSRGRSRLLTLLNLLLPFRNWRFAVMLGLIYFLYGWVYQVALPEIFPIAYVKATEREVAAADVVVRTTNERARVFADRSRTMQSEPWSTADGIKAATDLARIAGEEAKSAEQVAAAIKTRLEFQKKSTDPMSAIHGEEARKRLNAQGWWGWFKAYVAFEMSPDKFFRILIISPIFVFMLIGLWIGLIGYADVSRRIPPLLRGPIKFVMGTLHTATHLAMLLVINVLAQETSGSLNTVLERVLQSPEQTVAVGGAAVQMGAFYASLLNTLIIANHFITSIIVGGIVGGMIFGLYWVITSILWGWHMDSFSALGLKDYKNFLRMRFQPDKLTIYPIGLDKVPGRRGWRVPFANEVPRDHNPQIVPKRPLKPHLIEPPIVIANRPIV